MTTTYAEFMFTVQARYDMMVALRNVHQRQLAAAEREVRYASDAMRARRALWLANDG